MRRPLFLKIFLGVCLSFVFVTIIVWITDSILQENPSRTAERTAGVGLAGATSAIRLGGEEVFLQHRHRPIHDRAATIFTVADEDEGRLDGQVKTARQFFAQLHHVLRVVGGRKTSLP